MQSANIPTRKVTMNKANHFGVRWDENDDALALDERLNRMQPAARLSALLKVLHSNTFNDRGNLLRAASAYVCFKVRSPGKELLQAASDNYRFLRRNKAWLDSYGDDREELYSAINREHDMVIKQLSAQTGFTLATALTVIASAIQRSKPTRQLVSAHGVKYKQLSEFAEVSFEAFKNVVDGDKDLQDAKIAVEKAMRDTERGIELDQNQITNLYIPFVRLIAQRYYADAGSGHRSWEDIFDEATNKQIAAQFAVDYIAARQ